MVRGPEDRGIEVNDPDSQILRHISVLRGCPATSELNLIAVKD